MSALMPGQLLRLGPEASPQWVAPGIRLRLIRVHDWPTNEYGWAWLAGYQLDDAGDVIERRDVYVELTGVQVVSLPAVASIAPVAAKPRQRRPAA